MVNYNDEIISIEKIGEGKMMDIEVNKDHLFYANNILTKNSLGLPATADYMSILGTDEDAMIYQSELFYKVVKNRLGGRVGEIDKFYYDTRSLAMYDSTEIDLWISEATQTGDTRDLHEHQEVIRQTRGRRGQR